MRSSICDCRWLRKFYFIEALFSDTVLYFYFCFCFPFIFRCTYVGLSWHDPAPFQAGETLGNALLCPTKIYVANLMPLVKDGLLKVMRRIVVCCVCSYVTPGQMSLILDINLYWFSMDFEVRLLSIDLRFQFSWDGKVVSLTVMERRLFHSWCWAITAATLDVSSTLQH